MELFDGAETWPESFRVSKGTTKADSSPGAWSIDLSGVSEGPHTYSAKATDTGGTSSASNFVTVTVEDTTAPTVSGVSPAPGATKVARNICPIVTFSEKIDPTTLTASTVTLVKYGTTTTTISTRMELYDWPNQTGTSLCPSSNLAARTKYTVKLTSGVKDLAGNALVAHSWSFTTGSQ